MFDTKRPIEPVPPPPRPPRRRRSHLPSRSLPSEITRDTWTSPPRRRFTSEREGQMSRGGLRSAGWRASPWRPFRSCFLQQRRGPLHRAPSAPRLSGEPKQRRRDASTCCQQTEIRTEIKRHLHKKKRKKIKKIKKKKNVKLRRRRSRHRLHLCVSSRRNMAPNANPALGLLPQINYHKNNLLISMRHIFAAVKQRCD